MVVPGLIPGGFKKTLSGFKNRIELCRANTLSAVLFLQPPIKIFSISGQTIKKTTGDSMYHIVILGISEAVLG